ncbi:hemagglutinin/amebocyte aggregation factor-like [Montipora capricornis]|uniref:hemagglutinin/amebocyte aggregation factor-like n=1 Tax=Montipora capricornis TaxID=246305 RepID=UPI0035F20284
MIGKVTISVIVSLVFACALVSGEVINALKLAKRCEATGPDGTDWANEFDKPVDFLCERGKALTSIKSVYSSCRRDRVWSFGCEIQKPVKKDNLECQRTDFLNNWDEPVFKFCNDGGFIAGMYSEHSNSAEDRRFKIDCCRDASKKTKYRTTDCFSVKLTENYKEDINFELKQANVIRGLFSMHKNSKEDRLWYAIVCTLKGKRIY